MRILKTLFVPCMLLLSNLCPANTTLTESWMSNIPANKKMDQLIIPGSHDSGTYSITKNSYFSYSNKAPVPIWLQILSNLAPKSIVRAISANWTKTQPLNFTKQLNNGIRYLDLRVCREATLFQPNNFYLCHTQLADKLITGLNQVEQFVQQHPSEFVILDINHLINFSDATQEKALLKLLQTTLDNQTIPNTQTPESTIGALRQTNKHVILFVSLPYTVSTTDTALEKFITNSIWSIQEITSPWPRASNIKDLKSKLDTSIAFHAQNMQNENQFFVLQDVQTENTQVVINGILNPKENPNSIAPYEYLVNQALPNWINGYLSEYQKPVVNIVIQDWVQANNPIVSLAIEDDTGIQPQRLIKKVNGEYISEQELVELKTALSKIKS